MCLHLALLNAGYQKSMALYFQSHPVAGEIDDTRYEFRNFSEAEIINDMENVIDKIRRINSSIKFILRVSPAPLIATFQKENVLTATTYSNSALRSPETKI